MKPNDYIKKTAEQVSNEELRARLQEDLTEHIEDREDDGETGGAEVLGDGTVIARQVNAPLSRAVLGVDVALALFTGFVTLVVASISPEFVGGDVHQWTIGIALASILGLLIWLSAIGYLYLAVSRRFLEHHGSTVARFALLVIAFVLPWAFILLTEVLPSFFREDVAHAMIGIVMQAMLAGIFVSNDVLARRKHAYARRILGPSKKMVPIFIATASAIGIAGLVLDTSAWQGDALGMLLTPFVIPMLVMYFVWGMASMAVGQLAIWIGLPLLTGFWIVTALAIVWGVIVPFARVLARQRSLFPRVAIAFTFPLFVVLPLLPHDVPRADWHAPLVWSWEELERKQLNVTYPWSGALMHQEDGVNTGYAANVINDTIVVMQDKSLLARVTRDDVVTQENTIEIDWSGTGWYGPELPEGFACDGVDLREVSDTHYETTSPLGMFGMGCDELTYNGNLIANIDHGTLIDLDLADDGLLAVSINMGSYDPTYVYVVDIAQYMK